jgi:hypothetical protein
MDLDEAKQIILSELEPYREKSYSELISLIDEIYTYEIKGPSGVEYQIEIQLMWDGEKGGDVRAMGNIDDGGLRAFLPLAECFIMSPSGKFIDE